MLYIQYIYQYVGENNHTSCFRLATKSKIVAIWPRKVHSNKMQIFSTRGLKGGGNSVVECWRCFFLRGSKSIVKIPLPRCYGGQKSDEVEPTTLCQNYFQWILVIWENSPFFKKSMNKRKLLKGAMYK